jgi:hypothetical protein
MTKILAFALVVLPALPALAGGRTLALSTVAKAGTEKLRSTETQITVRAPRGTKLSQSLGGGIYAPISGNLNAAKTKVLYHLGKGDYYASPIDALFSIKK